MVIVIATTMAVVVAASIYELRVHAESIQSGHCVRSS
jgi:hypothetical protein